MQKERVSKTEVTRPGVVIQRALLSMEEQQTLIEIVRRHGGFKNEQGTWNFFGKRGRTFDSLKNYPCEDEAFLQECFQKMRQGVERANAQIPIAGCTHILTWWYPDQKGIGWHTDGYGGSDGDKDAPVYSLTLGNSCIFEWRPVGCTDQKEQATIESGDVIVFGGPQRLMIHRVKKVIRGSFPDLDARINITFRKLEEFSEEEEKAFQTDAYENRMRDDFQKRKDK